MILTLPRMRTRQETPGRSALWQSLQIHERRPSGRPSLWRRERRMRSRAAESLSSVEFDAELTRIDSKCWRDAVALALRWSAILALFLRPRPIRFHLA